MKSHRWRGPKSRRRMPSYPECNHARTHSIVTEAQTLEEALGILAVKRFRKPRRVSVNRLDEDLGYRQRKKITLPHIKWMDRKVDFD